MILSGRANSGQSNPRIVLAQPMKLLAFLHSQPVRRVDFLCEKGHPPAKTVIASPCEAIQTRWYDTNLRRKIPPGRPRWAHFILASAGTVS